MKSGIETLFHPTQETKTTRSVERSTIHSLTYHYGPRHRRVNATMIAERARGGKYPVKTGPTCHITTVETRIISSNGVHHVIVIGPSYRGSGRNCNRCRIERHIGNVYGVDIAGRITVSSSATL